MRIVALAFLGLALSSPATAGQQGTTRPSSRVIERIDVTGGAMPQRLLQTTNQAGDRETTTEIEEAPNSDGRMVPVRETVVEVIKAGTIVRTNSATFGVGPSGQRLPLETRESTVEQPGAGRARATSTTWRPDVNGRLAIDERISDETLTTPEGRRTERTIHRPDLNGRLHPMERSEHVERHIAPQDVRSTTTQSQVDVNNRWQVTEVRNRDTRTIGTTEIVEETIRQQDLNGASWERQRTVSRVTRQNGGEDTVVEMFDRGPYPFGSTLRPAMSGRIRRMTTPRRDGGHQIVEEVEERSPVAPDDPLRVVRRVVETMRRTGAGWETERQVFERDANNRLILTTSETEETRDR